jgi:hypothetical protein
MSTLVDKLRAAIEQRKMIAEAATSGEWLDDGGIHVGHPTNPIVDHVYDSANYAFIVANQPGVILRDCVKDLALLDAHLGYYGELDDEHLPSPTLTILAEAYGITEDHA